MADWQLLQAREAVRLYRDHFLEDEGREPGPGGPCPKPANLPDIIGKARQVLRVEALLL